MSDLTTPAPETVPAVEAGAEFEANQADVLDAQYSLRNIDATAAANTLLGEMFNLSAEQQYSAYKQMQPSGVISDEGLTQLEISDIFSNYNLPRA